MMTNNKIKSHQALMKTITKLKQKHKKIVFTNGCFDLLHLGHIKYLKAAKKKGDVLIVALNSDKSVKKIKGNARPIVSQQERARVIAALECTDYVIIFNEPTPLAIIKKLKPDIIVKGADWKREDIIGFDYIKKYGGKVIRVKFIEGYSTTQLIKKIVKKNSFR